MCAKKEKPKRKEDGYYWFDCEYCHKQFPSLSPLAKTCSQRCRNAKNNEIRNLEQTTEKEYVKNYMHNSKVLRKLFHELRGDPVEEQTLQLTRFNNGIDALTYIIGNVEYKKFGDYAIGKISRTLYKIISSHGIQ